MHNKSFTADNQLSIIGGRNIGDEYFDIDPDNAFADNENTEIAAIVESKALAQQLADNFIENIHRYAFEMILDEKGDLHWQGIENNKPVSFSQEPYTSWWQRFSTGFMRVLPVESQL